MSTRSQEEVAELQEFFTEAAACLSELRNDDTKKDLITRMTRMVHEPLRTIHLSNIKTPKLSDLLTKGL